ncbi:MAG TPA: hypothetical protein VIJ61_17755 [Thermoanaerobaculia bacterium]|jgi:hypothetical protein
MRNHRSLLLLLLSLPLPARAALTPVGSPLVIPDSSFCAFNTQLEVTATPAGAFEVIWADDGDELVKGLRYTRGLLPTGSPQTLLPIHGGLFFSDFIGTWAGRYEVALNAMDLDDNPDDPAAGYRLSLDLAGNLLAPAGRFKPPHFFKLAPAANGDSLQFRIEPPIFGSASCPSEGLLARRIDASGAALSAESRITRKASAFALGNQLQAARLPDDTFVVAYATCDKLTGIVARRLSSTGAPIGKPINLPLPDRVGNFSEGGLVLAARSGSDFVAGATLLNPSTGLSGSYTRGVVNGQVFGPTLIPTPPGAISLPRLIDLAASPAGGYLLLFVIDAGNPAHLTLFAQELDAKGVPQGSAVAVAAELNELGASSDIFAAAASLPNGRWIVVARVQNRKDSNTCSEQMVGTVLKSN